MGRKQIGRGGSGSRWVAEGRSRDGSRTNGPQRVGVAMDREQIGHDGSESRWVAIKWVPMDQFRVGCNGLGSQRVSMGQGRDHS